MIWCIAIISLAFGWLLYETKFLTIRLPYGRPVLDIYEIVPIVLATGIALKILSSCFKTGEK